MHKFLSLLLTLALLLPAGIARAQYPGSKYYPLVDGTSVTFVLETPSEVSRVQLYGDFLPGVNEYNLGGNVDMVRGEDGNWTYTAEGLAPDFYFYYYVVDGVRTLDPWNLKQVCNYSEFYNTFLVEGSGSENLDYADAPRGTMTSIWYDSPEYGGQRHLNVWLPAGYTPEKTYPALYMIPGGGDDEETWTDMGRLPQIMDNLIAKGEAEPMVVVLFNAMPNQLAAPHLMDPIPGAKSHFELMGTEKGKSGGEFVNDLLHNIIPLVESRYSVRRDREGRAVCGVSMGGVYEMYLAEHHPDVFGWYSFVGTGVMGGTPDQADAAVAPLVKTGYNLIWVGAGSKDMALNSAKNLMGALDRAKSPYQYYDCGDGHNWRSWRRDLQKFVPLLFHK
jgi:enterochelin esterase-like enzyme